MKPFHIVSAVPLTLALAISTAMAGELSIESWRVDDRDLWEKEIIPAFNQAHPDITVKFNPTAPTEYNASLNTRLAGGTAGDLITCRPFDISLELYNKGNLKDISALDGLKNFSEVARSAWQTDDAKTTFCLPMASVIHGFFYNRDIFTELGLSVPETEADFLAMLDKISKESQYTPMALGTNDGWETHQIVYTGIGPNDWKGEEGRKALIAGKAKMTDPRFVAPYARMAKWQPYLSKGYQSQTYGDSQNLFALGRAAIYPAGSWDIAYFNSNADFKMGAFKPPVANKGDTCYISDHTDIGMGINPASKNPADAETLLNWLASREFAELYTNKVTGFFSLSDHKINIEDPVAAEMISWRADCESTIRLNAQILSRGRDDLETAYWNAGQGVLNGTLQPEAAGANIQAILDK
ncbi:MAG: carbohydrate ABC transporter substrate-binding protein [Thiothrix sp.]|nr:carbohydrate ABC transporter substrate-binding protein [Thiothrix sp.]HPE62154.1 ABC transporter substrate-binding protein [Thiolinea sp.]